MAVMKIGGSIVAGDYCRDSGLVFIQAFQPCVTVVCELEKNFWICALSEVSPGISFNYFLNKVSHLNLEAFCILSKQADN